MLTQYIQFMLISYNFTEIIMIITAFLKGVIMSRNRWPSGAKATGPRTRFLDVHLPLALAPGAAGGAHAASAARPVDALFASVVAGHQLEVGPQERSVEAKEIWEGRSNGGAKRVSDVEQVDDGALGRSVRVRRVAGEEQVRKHV